MPDLEQAIIACRSGDMWSFSILYNAQVKKIYDFVFYKVFEKELAEDITSEVFMKALKSFSTFRGNSFGEFASWLYKIAYTHVVDHSRKHQEKIDVEIIAETHGESQDIAASIDAKTKLSEVLGFLDTLPIRDKDILVMRIWDELSFAEISELTGESVGNCKQIVSRSLKKIQDNIAFLLFLVFFIR